MGDTASEGRSEYLSSAERERLDGLRLADSAVDDALRQVDRILASPKFERVQRNARDFLGFVVAKKLLGRDDEIKEVTIAIHVYGEPADYDPAENTKIRMAGCDLRKRLRDYYAREGQNDAIEITIPDGTYVPEILDHRPTIAVALFENWTPDGDQSYLCTAVQDEIAHRLRHTGNTRVYSVTRLEAGDRRFRYALRGSLECLSNNLRLNTSLSDRHSGRILASQAFEAKRDDLLKLSRQAADAVLEAVKPPHPLVGNPRQPSHERFEALRLYQDGRWHLRRRTAGDIRKAIDLFEQAVEVNPEYARAYSGLADCHLILSWYELSTPDRLWFEVAKSYALTGLGLGPGLPEVHTSLAYAKLLSDFDWLGAEEEFQQAILIQNRYAQAHHWYGNLLVMQGRFAEAEDEMKRAFDLDPGSIAIRKTVADPFYYSRHYAEAIDRYNAALKIHPDFWMSHLFLGWAYQQAGENERALQEFEVVTARAGLNSIVQGAIGHLYATSGQEQKALSLLKHLGQPNEGPRVAPHTLAVVYAGLGDKDRAFEWLEASYENRIELLAWIKVDPRFDSLRGDDRFDRFLERVGLASTRSDAS